jgi:DNA ligase (NAD+)
LPISHAPGDIDGWATAGSKPGDLGYVASVADLYKLELDDFLEMKRRADERDGTVPETVKGGKVATKWAETWCRPSTPAAMPRWNASCSRSASPTSARARPRRWPVVRRPGFDPPPAMAVVQARCPTSAAGRSIGHFFDQPGNQQVIDALLERGVRIADAHAPSPKLRAVLDMPRCWPPSASPN